jgi:hypothetical protein
MDNETVVIMIMLFSLNYAALIYMYKEINSFQTVLKVLCREHAQNHGETELCRQ